MGVLISLFVLYGFGNGPEYHLFRNFSLSRLSLFFLSVSIIALFSSIIGKIWNIPLFDFLLDKMENRPSRRYFPGKGVFFFFFGAFLVSIFLSRKAVFASVFVVSVGDSLSHIVGEEFGRIRHPLSASKNIEGHLVAGLSAALGVAIIANMKFTDIIVPTVIAMFVEGIYFGPDLNRLIDDNLLIQVVFGLSFLVAKTFSF